MGDQDKREVDREVEKRKATEKADDQDRRLAKQRETPTPEPGKPATRFG